MKTLKRLVFLFLAVITFIPANSFPLRITNAHLNKFDSLLVDLSNDNVAELDLSWTSINNEQLADILDLIGGNLRTLNLLGCYNLDNFESIRNCTQLQELYLSVTNITDEQLVNILNKIGGSLRTLWLEDCRDIDNFWTIRNCTNLQELDLRRCKNLYAFEAIKNWSQERNVKFYW